MPFFWKVAKSAQSFSSTSFSASSTMRSVGPVSESPLLICSVIAAWTAGCRWPTEIGP